MNNEMLNNDIRELTIDELDAVTGTGVMEYIVECYHCLGQGTGNSGGVPDAWGRP